MRDPYDVLGVRRGATRAEIEAAYRNLSGKYAPEYYNGHPFEGEAKAKMDEINEAYDKLTLGNSDYATSDRSSQSYEAGGSGDFRNQGAGYGANNQQYNGFQNNPNQGSPYYRGSGSRSCCTNLACCCLADSCCEMCGGDLIACC